MLSDAFLSVHVHQFQPKLTVDHRSVADNNDSIDIGLIDHPLGKPGYRFCFAATRAVPDQIPSAHAIILHVFFAAQDSAKLMIAREDHFSLVINEHEFPDDTQQHMGIVVHHVITKKQDTL